MSSLGQSSGGWTESSSALRILNVGIRNSHAVLTDDAITQANPVHSTVVSDQVDSTKRGVLSGSVAFTRPDQGAEFVGGPGSATVKATLRADASLYVGYRPLGVFINSAAGNALENTPGVASGVGPYVCGGGVYGNSLFETHMIDELHATLTDGDAITYVLGQSLVASRNGFLMPQIIEGSGGALFHCDLFGGFNVTDIALTAEMSVRHTTSTDLDGADATALLNYIKGGFGSTVIGILKLVPDNTRNELVYDQRI